MLIAARNSQDFACCLRATASARSKHASAFATSGSGNSSAISPAMRLASASNHLSLVVSTVVHAELGQFDDAMRCIGEANSIVVLGGVGGDATRLHIGAFAAVLT